ncbi:MAG: O-antigen ligase family protein [Pseudomonadota bacterium]
MSILALVYVAFACVVSLFAPWLGVLFYYLFSVGQMQSMWPHHFGLESRVALMMTAATFIGLCGATAIKAVNYRTLILPHTLAIVALTAWVNLSIPYSSYLLYHNALPGELTQAEIISIFNKIIVFYFFAVLLINTRKKLVMLIYAFAAILVYYAWWANMMYFTGQFWLFGINGRLGGMPRSVYFDENYLAMLFVFATPVLYYIGISYKNFYIRYGIWSLIPMTWHALFLTGSRGGLLSLAVVIIYLFFRSFHRLASIGIIAGLVVAVIFQSGVLLNRVDNTIDAAQTDEEIVSEEAALDPRLVSWKVGSQMVADYPVFGVGVGNFTIAFPDYSNTKRHVAHNTFLQFSAECGLLAGLLYLWWFWMRLKNVFKKPAPGTVFEGGLHRDYLEDLLNSLFIGLFMVGVFLDLMIFEIVYMIFMLSAAKYAIEHKVPTAARAPKKTIYRVGQNEEDKQDLEPGTT